MTRTQRIAELDLLIQELKIEERIATWLEARTSVEIATCQAIGEQGVRFACVVSANDQLLAVGKGATESDARAQAFSTIFANEAAAKLESR